jgi:hypothetical protein
MNRNFASIFGTIGPIALSLATASGTANADDITIDNTPFTSTKSRAEVRAELLRPAQLVSSGASEWVMQFNQAPQIKSGITTEQARAEYQASRDLVRALNGEDSGSAYFIKGPMQGTATMGGPAR